ncbi:site-specific integrase [Acinetobacter oleivorans]|uniref:site-specific integrase n=1 Tax=Acinetobacter oleivorans TaxID=1148157 RepID=UPI003A895BD2
MINQFYSTKGETTSEAIFNSEQVIAIQKINKKLPKIVKFVLADNFEDKFIISENNIWDFYYSGKREVLDFTQFPKKEMILLKFLLISYIQKNSPSSLSLRLRSFKFLIDYLKKNSLFFEYEAFKKLLTHIAALKEHRITYSNIKFFLKTLIIENFPKFDIDNDYDLEFLPRPDAFNSSLFYQLYEDPIDFSLLTIIQQGLTKLNSILNFSQEQIQNQTLINASILGLVYSTGLRPVQLSKLAVKDIIIDTYREADQFYRYSILIPYAKQERYIYEKIAVKLSEEIAQIILAYIKRFNLEPQNKLFDLGDNSALFCFKAINTQLFDFSPENYKKAVLAGEMLEQKYSVSDFRHHVGYSLAMAGASAEEISYILGHSVVVTARHYIYSTPEIAQIRAHALGQNPLYKQMITMLLTGHLVYRNEWNNKKVLGNIGSTIHYDIGGCSYNQKCLFQPVRNCYGCMYFHPFIDGDHTEVLNSIQNEINQLIKLSDNVGASRNPLIRIHEATKFEIESVIARCTLNKDAKNG